MNPSGLSGFGQFVSMGPSAASFSPYGPSPGPLFFNGPAPSINQSYLSYNGAPATSWQSGGPPPTPTWTGGPSNMFYRPPQSAPYIQNEMFNPNFTGGYDPYSNGPWGPNYGMNSSMIDPSTLTPAQRHWEGFAEDPSVSNISNPNPTINNNTINPQVTNTNTNTNSATNGPSLIPIPGWSSENPWTKSSTVRGALQEYGEHILATALPEEKEAFEKSYNEQHQEGITNWNAGAEIWKKLRETVDFISSKFTKPDTEEETIQINKSSFLPFKRNVYGIGENLVEQRGTSQAKHQSHLDMEMKNNQMLQMNNLIRSLMSNETTEFTVGIGRNMNKLWGPQYKLDENGDEIQSLWDTYFHSRFQNSDATATVPLTTKEPQEPILPTPTPTTTAGRTTGGLSNTTSGGRITDDLFSGLNRNRFGLFGNMTSPFSNLTSRFGNLTQGLGGLTSGFNSLFGGGTGTGISAEDLLQINRAASVLSSQTGLSLAEARQCILQNGTDLFEEDVPMLGNGFERVLNRGGAW